MNNDLLSHDDLDPITALKKERTKIASLAPKDALDRILEYRQPAALVHSLPEEDFYFLVHDIGPEDALPLLSLASGRQLDFILDREIWAKDRMNTQAVTQWFDLMMRAGSQRFVNWLIRERAQLLEFYLFRNIEIRVREHDEDPSEFPEDFFTVDDVLYARIRDEVSDSGNDFSGEYPNESPGEYPGEYLGSGSGGIGAEKRREVLRKLLESIAFSDYQDYHNVLYETIHVLPAEVEEEAYRQRNVRLEEKGFLPFDEAVAIYRPLAPERLARGKSLDRNESKVLQDQMIPLAPLTLIPADNVFTHSLALILDDVRMIELQAEFATLCNQIIVADHKQVRKKEDLRPVVKKACGYISIGMEQLIQGGAGIADSAALLQRHRITPLFQVGYGRINELMRRAGRFVKESWFAAKGLRISFWDEKWVGVLGGLLLKRPLFFDNYQTGVLYRDFESMTDLLFSEKTLNDIIACDRLLSLTTIHIPPIPPGQGGWTYKSLLLTLWAGNRLGLSGDPGVIPADQFAVFYADLWEGKGKRRKIRPSMKASFLNFVAEKTGLKDFEITQQAGGILEDLFLEIESEYAGVSGQHLDPRFIRLFLIKS